MLERVGERRGSGGGGGGGGKGVRVSLASAAVLEFSCVCPPISQ